MNGALRPLFLVVRLALGAGALLLAAACSGDAGERPLEGMQAVSPPDPDSVESVIFFLGDPGEATFATHPVLDRLQRGIERWSGALARDSAVAVVVLGDIVYPEGLRPPDAPERSRDADVVLSQVETVRGPEARRHGSFAVFTVGNHDWGYLRGDEGEARVRGLEAFLDSARVLKDASVELLPEAGSGGPAVVDMGEHLRMVLLDTAWWLLSREPERKDDVVAGVERALAEAGERRVVVAAHHPWFSAGPHGGARSLRDGFGIPFLLARSGARLQDLNSRPYRDLRRRLQEVFRRERRPFLFAGGHEHSLQLLELEGDRAPDWSLISGSASKLTRVDSVAGTRYGRSAPGFAWITVRTDGAIDLFLDAADEQYLECEPRDEPDGAACFREGAAAYRTVFSRRLVEPRRSAQADTD